MSPILLGLALAFGCGSEPDEPAPPDTGDLSYPWEDEGAPQNEPSLSDTEIQAALDEVFAHTRTLDPAYALDAFEALLADVSEEDCPTYTEYTNRTDINADCTTTEGVTLVIDVRWDRPEASTNPKTGAITHEDALMLGDAVIYDDDGVLWNMAHWVSLIEKTLNTGYRASETRLLGVVSTDQDGWISQGLSTALDAVWYTQADSSTPGAFAAQGGASGLSESTIEAYIYHEISMQVTAMDGPCDIEPHGSIWFRTSDGVAYQIDFDGPDATLGETVTEKSQCDGCGTLSFQGEEVGAICVDVSGLLNWEERPW